MSRAVRVGPGRQAKNMGGGQLHKIGSLRDDVPGLGIGTVGTPTVDAVWPLCKCAGRDGLCLVLQADVGQVGHGQQGSVRFAQGSQRRRVGVDNLGPAHGWGVHNRGLFHVHLGKESVVVADGGHGFLLRVHILVIVFRILQVFRVVQVEVFEAFGVFCAHPGAGPVASGVGAGSRSGARVEWLWRSSSAAGRGPRFINLGTHVECQAAGQQL